MKKKIFKCIRDSAIYIAIIIFFLSFLVTSFGYFQMKPVKEVNNNIQRLEKRIVEIEMQMKLSGKPTEQTEYLKAIDYLESETTKYRGFIQEQQNYLIWLFGVAASVFFALMIFLGIESRKKISEVFREKYAEMVKYEISDFIGGNGQKEYLMQCIEKEKRAKEKKILFLEQRETDQNLEKIYEFLEEHEYNVRQRNIQDSMREETIGKIIKGYDVVIYQVDKSEYEERKKENVPDNNKSERKVDGETEVEKNYVKISNQCDRNKIYGIFYTTGRIDLTKCSCVYVSTANFGATLLDRINRILYFTQELSDD